MYFMYVLRRYVCVCVCMYVCMYVRTYVCMYVCICTGVCMAVIYITLTFYIEFPSPDLSKLTNISRRKN